MTIRKIRPAWWDDADQLADGSRMPDRGPAGGQVRRAWMQLFGALLALCVLAAELPGPWTTVTLLVGQRNIVAGGFGGLADTAMLSVTAILVWALLLWGLTVAAMAGLGRLPGAGGVRARRALARVAPIAVRNVLLTVVGASIVTGLTACGTSTPAAAGVSGKANLAAASSVTSTSSADFDDAPLLEAPVVAAVARSWIAVEGSAVHLGPVRHAPIPHHAAPKTPVGVDWPTTGADTGGGVVVLRGDSLWSIAARHLPPTAGPADIDRAWHGWYAANTAVIGSNPNLILPGQILLPPDSGTGPRS